MRVLVTGYDGYVGSVLVPLLRRDGHAVRGVDSRLYAGWCLGAWDAPAAVAPPEGCGPGGARIDVRDVDEACFAGADAVVHLAALSNDPIGDVDPAVTLDVNHVGTVRVAEAARAAGVARFVYASSCSLYGVAGTDALLDETAPMHPLTAYGESKVRAEASLTALADDGFHPTFLRNATSYGPSPRFRADLVVNDLAGLAVTTGAITLRSDGSPWRPLLHVEDLGRAVLAALAAPVDVVHARAFNIAEETENYQVRTVAALIAAAVPGSRVSIGSEATPDLRDYRVGGARATAELGFRPRWTLAAGIAQLVAVLRRSGLTLSDLTGEHCRRVRRIAALQAAGELGPDLRWTSGQPV